MPVKIQFLNDLSIFEKVNLCLFIFMVQVRSLHFWVIPGFKKGPSEMKKIIRCIPVSHLNTYFCKQQNLND